MNITFYIREAVPTDREILVGFMTQLQEFERTLHSNRSDGTLIGSEHLANDWINNLNLD
ncbi:hypothetical protein [Hydrococcus rivularis]|uniref:hypothetical protein n=1 Tax=Hydrococcus rivularis TaxID=1616834 RepID=UPI000A9FE590|nr:hypothetical protein [Hydrococcus rivularis]